MKILTEPEDDIQFYSPFQMKYTTRLGLGEYFISPGNKTAYHPQVQSIFSLLYEIY